MNIINIEDWKELPAGVGYALQYCATPFCLTALKLRPDWFQNLGRMKTIVLFFFSE
ncbi:MAG TPA: hypothetical protein PLJ84_08420 [Bacteroidales bacterium]|nr:hypothetical protein [Bacteroidales bacterium]